MTEVGVSRWRPCRDCRPRMSNTKTEGGGEGTWSWSLMSGRNEMLGTSQEALLYYSRSFVLLFIKTHLELTWISSPDQCAGLWGSIGTGWLQQCPRVQVWCIDQEPRCIDQESLSRQQSYRYPPGNLQYQVLVSTSTATALVVMARRASSPLPGFV